MTAAGFFAGRQPSGDSAGPGKPCRSQLGPAVDFVVRGAAPDRAWHRVS